MAHDHNHISPAPASGSADRMTRAFRLGIWINLLYVIIEAAFGFFYNSMGLLSDAGHNLSDVASLLIALIAFRAARIKPTNSFTYGYRKATVMASVVNAIILYVAVVLILIESIEKILNPVAVDGEVVAWVAGIGIVINGFTAFMFLKDSKQDLNIKGAYLHMVADTLVSVGVVVAGIVMMLTGWYLVDPIIGIIIALIIAVSSWSLLRESLRLAFDGVPSGIDLAKVKESILGVEAVESLHHLHVWSLSTTDVAMTVHVVVRDAASIDRAIAEIRAAVAPLGINHPTIEAETAASGDCQCNC